MGKKILSSRRKGTKNVKIHPTPRVREMNRKRAFSNTISKPKRWSALLDYHDNQREEKKRKKRKKRKRCVTMIL